MIKKDPNVLLIDDDRVYLFFMSKVIQKISDRLAIETFTDGEEAVQFLSRHVKGQNKSPEVIFLDINMPFLDGWGFLAEFKKLSSKMDKKKINIYMVSSSSRKQDIQRAAQFEELTGYYIKPVNEEDLTKVFEQVYADNW